MAQFALGRASAVVALISIGGLALVFSQFKAGVDIPYLREIVIGLGIFAVISLWLMYSAMKAHAKKHGYFR